MLTAVGVSGLLSLSGAGAALAAPALQSGSAGSTSAAGGVLYTGKTSQNKNFILVRRGNVVKKVKWGWKAHCLSGKTLKLSTKATNIPVNASGKWSASGHYRVRLRNGYRAHVFGAIDGKFPTLNKVKGFFKMKAKIYKNGAHVDTCTTHVQAYFANA